jgi:hypothetical protein
MFVITTFRTDASIRCAMTPGDLRVHAPLTESPDSRMMGRHWDCQERSTVGSLPLRRFLIISVACAFIALGGAGCRDDEAAAEATEAATPVVEAPAAKTPAPSPEKERVAPPGDVAAATPEKSAEERRMSARQRAVDRAKARVKERARKDTGEPAKLPGPENRAAAGPGAPKSAAPTATKSDSETDSKPAKPRSAVTRAAHLAKRDVPMPNGSAKKGRKPVVIQPSSPPTKKTRSDAPPSASRRSAPLLPISHALNAVELKTLTGKSFRADELVGQLPSSRYNTVYFRTGKGGDYGVSVQLWHEPALRDTRARYENMKSTYPNVTETGNVTHSSFFAHWGEVHHLVFMDLKKRRVVSVSAGNQTLTPDQLYAVATTVRDRLLR